MKNHARGLECVKGFSTSNLSHYYPLSKILDNNGKDRGFGLLVGATLVSHEVRDDRPILPELSVIPNTGITFSCTGQ